jgi:mannose-6-phosphate isomerase-like protein (cupin superfamily)
VSFDTSTASGAPVVVAPDGSEVRLLCSLARGGMALFSLPAGAVSRAVAHRSVEEAWYFLSGRGRMWRKLHGREETVDVAPGTCLTLPTGTHFQFRCDGPDTLTAVAVTMPPWPGDQEAYPVTGPWQATV